MSESIKKINKQQDNKSSSILRVGKGFWVAVYHEDLKIAKLIINYKGINYRTEITERLNDLQW